MAESSRPRYLDEEATKACAARIRCLDHYMAQHMGGSFGSDYDFVASMKDWVDKKKAPISFRQEWRINQIWKNITEHTELDATDFSDAPKRINGSDVES